MNTKRFKISVLFIVAAVYMMFCGYTKQFDETQNKVYDDAQLFTADEIDTLQKMCVGSAEGTKLDIAVATVDDTNGKSSMKYAEDFYDDNGLGYDQGASGLILLIDMDNREIYISTAGIAIQYFNDDDIEDILTDLDDYMAYGDYYNAAVTYVNDVVSHVSYINDRYYSDVEPWFEGDYEDFKDYEDAPGKTIFANPLIDLLIALAISAVIVAIMSFNSKSKMTVDANTYINRNEFDIHRSMDTYLRTSVTKHKISSSGSSGSGHRSGSHHRSSSGRSHGGGGHRF